MNKKLTTFLLAFLIMIIGKSEAATLTQKLGGSAISATVNAGQEVTLIFNNRANYTFKKWIVESGNVTVNTTSKTVTFIMPNENVVIRANYEEETSTVTEYTLTYNANGGSGAPSSQTGTTLTISSTKPTRSGYTFKGWSKSSSATSASYNAGGSITLSANTTLYAVWEQNATEYTLTYNANGGSGAPSSQTGTTLTISSTTPTRSGYTFKGWSKSSSATTASYSAGGSITISANTTLYAVWEQNATEYTLTYNANGGSGAPSSQTGTTLTISNTKPTRSGYTFKGWSTSSSATSASYSAGGSITLSANTTLYAVWEQDTKTITLTYNANGGKNAPSSQTVTTKDSYTFTISSTKPTKSGYTFKGWSKSNNATSASYNAGKSITLSENTTLYAVWEITLIYNANGGSGAPSSQTATTNDSYTFTISSTKPTRSGYTFKGWSTNSSATTASYNAGGSITLSESTTLYAVWEKTLTLTYNANGGSGAPDSQIVIITTIDSYTFTISNTKPTRSGYTFNGWSTSSNATSASYSAGGSITLSANTTLYAVWEQNTTTYTLTYNANGGSGAPSSQTVTATKDSYTFTISNTTPTRSGYTFKGWSKGSSSTIAGYSAGGSITLSENTTLYAVWKQNTYTLTYNANGGSGAPSSQTGTTLTISSTKPTRSGYTFKGWSKSSSATTVSYSAGGSITLSANTTLYAVWEQNTTTYTLTYNANGGSGAPSSQTGTTTGTSCTITISSTKPTRSGYTFKGWATSSSATSASYNAGGSITLSGNTTLYAVWEQAYTLTYNANGGSGAPSSQTGTTLTISSTKPTRSGYTFKGWSKSSSATTVSYSAGGSITLSANTTLYAVWEQNTTTYTLTYNANGGSGAPSSQTGTTTGTSCTITISSTKPTRSGYTFKGWATSSSATSASYNAGGSITLSGNTTLYAVWEQAYTLTYNANGGSGAPSAQTGKRIEISSTTPTRTGYTFVGWSKSSSATSASYNAGGYITLSADTTLYAVWELNIYTVKFDVNADDVDDELKPDDIIITIEGEYNLNTGKPYDDGVVVLSILNLTREGYNFLYWSTDKYYSWMGTHYNQDEEYEPKSLINQADSDKTITLYAWWEKRSFTESNASTSSSEAKEYWVVFKDPDEGGYKSFNGSTHFYLKGKCFVEGTPNYQGGVYLKNNNGKIIYPWSSDGLWVFVKGDIVEYYGNHSSNSSEVYSASLDSCLEGDEIVFYIQ